MRRYLAWSAPLLALILIMSGCSGDNPKSGAPVEPTTTTAPAEAENPLVASAVKSYQAYAVDQTNQIVALTKVFTDAVRAGNLAAAQEAYAPSRVPWERIEPIAGLVEQIDAKVDARVDDFEGVDDPAFTGWHRLEYLLWERNTTKDAKKFADQLDADIATLSQRIRTIEFPPAVVAIGPSELIQEVSQGKITGEEDRYSHTDLWDFDANVDGSKKLVELLTPSLQAKDAALLGEIQAGFTQIDQSLSKYALPGGAFKPYTELTGPDKETMKAQLAGLAERLSRIPGVLGLR
jgi:iron uptake system component EfeO